MEETGRMGRPKKEIDRHAFEGALKVGCTLDEVCSIFQTTDKTVNRWCRDTYGTTFSEVYKKFSSWIKISLRRNLLKQSADKPGVAIFLAKNLLGMRDDPAPVADGSEAIEFKRAISRASRLWSDDPQAEAPAKPTAGEENPSSPQQERTGDKA